MATINSELLVTVQKSIDGKAYKIVSNKSVPYTNAADFLATVTSTRRHIGLTAWINGDDSLELWQFSSDGIADGNFVKIFPVTSGSTTADNGLTKTLSNIQFGGPLTGNTSIDIGGFTMTFTGTGAGNGTVVSVISTGSSDGVFGSSDLGNAVRGAAVGGIGVFGSSSTGVGVMATSAQTAIIGNANGGPNNGISDMFQLRNNPVAAAAAGIGLQLTFQNKTSAGTAAESNTIVSKWLDPALATRTSELSFTGFNSGTKSVLLKIDGAGLFTLVQGLRDFANDAAAALGTPAIPVNGLYKNGSVVQIRVS